MTTTNMYNPPGDTAGPWDPNLGGIRTLDPKDAVGMLRDHLKRHPEIRPDQIEEAYDRFTLMLDGMVADVSAAGMEALRPNDRLHEREGEFVSDATAVLTDGNAFGYSDTKSAGRIWEINVCLDASGSMGAVDGIEEIPRIVHGKREFVRVVNKTGRANPLTVAPRMFFASLCARGLLKALVNAQQLSPNLKVRGFMFSDAVAEYHGEVYMMPPAWFGGGTPIEPLVRRIQEAETAEPSTGSTNRLDLIITDGAIVKDWGNTRPTIDEMQSDRAAGGYLKTVVLRITADGGEYTPPYGEFFRIDNPIHLAQTMDRVVVDYFTAR